MSAIPMPEGQPLRLECTNEDYHMSLTIAVSFRIYTPPVGEARQPYIDIQQE